VKIGESIRRKEVKTSWTQEQLAPEAGIIEKALCRIESNEVEPPFCGFGS
jgi:DNA-binding XRE family transcriptional regulator